MYSVLPSAFLAPTDLDLLIWHVHRNLDIDVPAEEPGDRQHNLIHKPQAPAGHVSEAMFPKNKADPLRISCNRDIDCIRITDIG